MFCFLNSLSFSVFAAVLYWNINPTIIAFQHILLLRAVKYVLLLFGPIIRQRCVSMGSLNPFKVFHRIQHCSARSDTTRNGRIRENHSDEMQSWNRMWNHYRVVCERISLEGNNNTLRRIIVDLCGCDWMFLSLRVFLCLTVARDLSFRLEILWKGIIRGECSRELLSVGQITPENCLLFSQTN